MIYVRAVRFDFAANTGLVHGLNTHELITLIGCYDSGWEWLRRA